MPVKAFQGQAEKFMTNAIFLPENEPILMGSGEYLAGYGSPAGSNEATRLSRPIPASPHRAASLIQTASVTNPSQAFRPVPVLPFRFVAVQYLCINSRFQHERPLHQEQSCPSVPVFPTP